MRHVFRKTAAALIAAALVLSAPSARAYAQAMRSAAKGAVAAPVPPVGTLSAGLNTSAGSVPLGAPGADPIRLALPVPSALEAVVPAEPSPHAAAANASRHDGHAVPAGVRARKQAVLPDELAHLEEKDAGEQERALDQFFAGQRAKHDGALAAGRPANSPRPALQAVSANAVVGSPSAVRSRWSRLEPIHRVASAAASLSLVAYGMHRLMMDHARSAFYSEILRHRPLTPHELFDRGSFNDFLTVPVAAAMVYLLGLSFRSIGLSRSTLSVGRQSLRDGYTHVVMWFMPALAIWYEISQGPGFDFMDVIMYLAGAALAAPVQHLLWWPRADGPEKDRVVNAIILLAMTAVLGGLVTGLCIGEARLPLAALLVAGAFFALRPDSRGSD